MNIENVSMGGVDYPIEKIITEENGHNLTKFVCKLPDGKEKYLHVKHTGLSPIEKDRLREMVMWEIRTGLFQEIHGVKIADMWERFAKSSLVGDELRNMIDQDPVFKKFVEEFYPEHVKE